MYGSAVILPRFGTGGRTSDICKPAFEYVQMYACCGHERVVMHDQYNDGHIAEGNIATRRHTSISLTVSL
jgi:hypothetical protein